MAEKVNGTWREQQATIKPGVSEVVYFRDTKPNYFHIVNSSASPLYVSLSGESSANTYDIAIPPYGTRVHQRMHGSDRIYLFSNATDQFRLVISSWEGEFDPASLAQSQEMVGAGADGLLGIVEVNNLLSPLPAGTNNIGGVVVNEFARPLPTGNNVIGRVQVEPLPAGTASIGKVEVTKAPDNVGTALKVTAAAPGVVIVKNAPGTVFALKGAGVLQDGAAQIWDNELNAPGGVQISTAINLLFQAAGTSFILYK